MHRGQASKKGCQPATNVVAEEEAAKHARLHKHSCNSMSMNTIVYLALLVPSTSTTITSSQPFYIES
jgi:hypothetical protein